MRLATTLRDPRIESARLVLRPLGEADLDALVAEVSDFAVTRMLAKVPYPYTREDGEAFLAASRRYAGIDFSLAVTHEDRVIGGVGLSAIRGRSEFGYWLGRRHWGKGYATEAGLAFLTHVFDAFDLKLIHSGVFFDNPASLRVQQKLGFVESGRRQVECLARGRKIEHIDTALTRARFRILVS